MKAVKEKVISQQVLAWSYRGDRYTLYTDAYDAQFSGVVLQIPRDVRADQLVTAFGSVNDKQSTCDVTYRSCYATLWAVLLPGPYLKAMACIICNHYDF